jgi:predicted phage tail protein
MGTPIAITSGVATTGIDIALAAITGPPRAPVNFIVTSDASGVRLTWAAGPGPAPVSYSLEAGFAAGSTALSIPVAGTSYLAAGVPPGRYFVRVRGVNAAGAGAASTEVPLTVGGGSVAAPGPPLAPQFVMMGSRLILWWSFPTHGGAPVDYIVEAGSASGLANIAAMTASVPAFTYDPVPSGFYFLRVRARNAGGVSDPSDEVMIVAVSAASPPGQVRVSAAVNGSTVTLNWFAPPGPVTGYVIEAGTAPGLSNLAALPIGGVTSRSFPGMPPGRYYVRIRAVNELGRGIASIELTLVVE